MEETKIQNGNGQTAPKNIYDLFDLFLEKTIIGKKNFFPTTHEEEIFDAKELEKLVEICKSLKSGFKTEDINNEIKQVSDQVKKIYGHILWLQNLPVKDTSKSTIIKEISAITQLNTEYSKKGVVRYGRARRQKARDIADLILLFYLLCSDEINDLEEVKKNIIYWCLNLTEDGKIPDDKGTGIRSKAYGSDDGCPSELLPIHNMLLHLCKKEHYDDISVSAHKKKIVETFNELISENLLKQVDIIIDDGKEYNRKYYIVLNELYKMKKKDTKVENYKDLWGEEGIGEKIRIYDSEYKNLWNVGSDDDDSEINALKFKKAIILYGPPGTSKTYSAKALARNLIFQKDFEKKKVKEYLEKTEEDFKRQIHRLQLHPNWTYEDFIWGYQIKIEEYKDKESEKVVCVGNKTVAKKGYFLRLLDEMKNDPSKTHILILDEINRVDLSRLFGELFSAIESRNESVNLPVTVEGTDSVSIPDNLYIIGTMNEIDFSLERVDFALRRRFAWFFYGYNENTLASILEDKLVDVSYPEFDDNARAEYVQDCTNLNNKIDEDSDLGPQYQIGHTFFAELVDIWKDVPDKKIKFVKTILWNISIGPMIEAYLGNCDKKTKDDKVKVYRKTFGIDEK